MSLIAGVDEVGRGPLAGSVIAAAVILKANHDITGLADSKALSEKKRQKLAVEIKKKALCWSIGEASVAEIDMINILNASMLAMKRAILALKVEPTGVLVDGNRCPEDLPCHCDAIVKGDSKIQAISAASIIAKVYRDNMMLELHKQYPRYGFASHKGYPTKLHREALEQYGVIDAHRRSFAPVRKIIALGKEKTINAS